jgi:hypothetical protein
MSKATALSIIALLLGSFGFGMGMYVVLSPAAPGPQGSPGEPGEPGVPGIGNLLQVVEDEVMIYTYITGNAWDVITNMEDYINVTAGSRLFVFFSMTVHLDIGRDQRILINVTWGNVSAGIYELIDQTVVTMRYENDSPVIPITLMLLTDPLPIAGIYWVEVCWHPGGGLMETYNNNPMKLTIMELGA